MLEATAALYGLESVEDFVQHQAIRRIIEPEEVAAAICWILSEESSAMTGAVMQVDGGFDG
jgi:NAD(P)-dependent dehydrogenase (short-subunit alcohol dehydrogenase family)